MDNNDHWDGNEGNPECQQGDWDGLPDDWEEEYVPFYNTRWFVALVTVLAVVAAGFMVLSNYMSLSRNRAKLESYETGERVEVRLLKESDLELDQYWDEGVDVLRNGNTLLRGRLLDYDETLAVIANYVRYEEDLLRPLGIVRSDWRYVQLDVPPDGMWSPSHYILVIFDGTRCSLLFESDVSGVETQDAFNQLLLRAVSKQSQTINVGAVLEDGESYDGLDKSVTLRSYYRSEVLTVDSDTDGLWLHDTGYSVEVYDGKKYPLGDPLVTISTIEEQWMDENWKDWMSDDDYITRERELSDGTKVLEMAYNFNNYSTDDVRWVPNTLLVDRPGGIPLEIRNERCSREQLYEVLHTIEPLPDMR